MLLSYPPLQAMKAHGGCWCNHHLWLFGRFPVMAYPILPLRSSLFLTDSLQFRTRSKLVAPLCTILCLPIYFVVFQPIFFLHIDHLISTLVIFPFSILAIWPTHCNVLIRMKFDNGISLNKVQFIFISNSLPSFHYYWYKYPFQNLPYVDARVHIYAATALGRSRMSSPTLGRLYPRGRTRYSFYRRLSGPQEQSGREGVKKKSPPLWHPGSNTSCPPRSQAPCRLNYLAHSRYAYLVKSFVNKNKDSIIRSIQKWVCSKHQKRRLFGSDTMKTIPRRHRARWCSCYLHREGPGSNAWAYQSIVPVT